MSDRELYLASVIGAVAGGLIGAVFAAVLAWWLHS